MKRVSSCFLPSKRPSGLIPGDSAGGVAVLKDARLEITCNGRRPQPSALSRLGRRKFTSTNLGHVTAREYSPNETTHPVATCFDSHPRHALSARRMPSPGHSQHHGGKLAAWRASRSDNQPVWTYQHEWRKALKRPTQMANLSRRVATVHSMP